MKFTFQTPTRLIFGSGRLDALGDEKLPGKKALLLTSRGKSAERTGALERTMKALERAGAQYVYCPMVESNPVVDNVMKAALAAREAECDFVIALGGGSVMGIYGAYHTSMTSDDGVQTMASRLTEALGDSVIFYDLREE